MSDELRERAEVIAPGFVVADAGVPSLQTINEGLEVRFVDYRKQSVEVVFRDAVAFSWEQTDYSLLDGERYDSTHIIHHSSWLQKYIAQNVIFQREAYRHYRLNFNAAGILQVIAKDIQAQVLPETSPH